MPAASIPGVWGKFLLTPGFHVADRESLYLSDEYCTLMSNVPSGKSSSERCSIRRVNDLSSCFSISNALNDVIPVSIGRK